MTRARKKNSKELEERLRALKKEQRRLNREITSLARDSVKSTGSSQKSRPSKSKRGSRSRSSGGAPQARVEMKAYLSNGSFRGKRKLRHERAVQRNKAIFMLVLACFALYIFFAWVY